MLIIDNLTVSLEDKIILNNLALTIEQGTAHVLMGPNGSGKSTLAYALMGHPLYTINQGSVLLYNTTILDLPVEKRARAGLFLVCQYPQEVPGVQVFTFLKEAHRMLTGLELSVTEFKELVYQAFDAVKLDHSFATRNLYEGFSGGEKKRLEIAQLLLFKPKIAILDEVDSGLDVDALKIIAQAINRARELNPELSLLLITHYTRILEHIAVDHVSVISHGTIIKSGDRTLATTIDRQGYHELLL